MAPTLFKRQLAGNVCTVAFLRSARRSDAPEYPVWCDWWCFVSRRIKHALRVRSTSINVVYGSGLASRGCACTYDAHNYVLGRAAISIIESRDLRSGTRMSKVWEGENSDDRTWPSCDPASRGWWRWRGRPSRIFSRASQSSQDGRNGKGSTEHQKERAGQLT